MDLGLTQREIAMLLWGVAKAAIILIVGILVARLIRSWILRLGTRRRIAMNVATLLANLAQVGLVVFAVILILPTFGVDWAGLLTVVGTVGLAISLAFQDLLRNFIAGIYILLERPFQIGDEIAIGPAGAVSGTVQSISLRTTALRTADGLLVVVPNNNIFTDVLTNRSAVDLRRHLLNVSVPPGENTISHVVTCITDALRTVPEVAGTPAPSTEVENIGAAAWKLQIEFWTPPAQSDSAELAVAEALRRTLPGAEVAVVS